MTTMFPARTRAPGVRESTPEAPLVAAVDGSPASLAAVEEAISLAPELDAPLVFAYVRRRPRGYLGAPYDQRQLTGAMARARGERSTVPAASQPPRGVEAEAEILEGNPSRRIVEFAHDRGAQMVIVGSRRRLLSRSVSRGVARAADRPVMVAAPAGAG